MKRSSVLLLFVISLLCLVSPKANAQEEEQLQPAGTFQKYSKWGIGVDFSRSFLNIGLEEAWEKCDNEEIDLMALLLNNSTGPQIDIYYNWRIARFLYYQPEITYAIYNMTVDDVKTRSMFLRITPIQLQFGVHLGWVRPYVFAGAYLNIALNIRDMADKSKESEKAQAESFGSRLYWGYTYGGGVDFLSFFQVQYRRNLWMNPFTSFTKSMHLVDEALCISFFF